MNSKKILNNDEISAIIDSLSKKIYEDIKDVERFAIVGIQASGVELANRIRRNIETYSGRDIRHGTLDITFYRDDLSTRGILPVIKETRIEFNIAQMVILLVDDVIFTGRTTKAALETLMSFGRPSMIKLFCLVDRGNRELPIQPDYCGYTLSTDPKDRVNVIISTENREEDSVVLEQDK